MKTPGENNLTQIFQLIEERYNFLKVATEPLIGTTEEITPEQVSEALEAGRSITLTHTHENYGTFKFNNFAYSQDNQEVYSSTVINLNVTDALCTLVRGGIRNEQWVLQNYIFANKRDIPTDEYINNLIGEKLEAANNTFLVNVIPSLSASGMSFSLPSDVTVEDIAEQYEAGKHVVAVINIPSAAGSNFAGLYMLPLVKKFETGRLVFSVQLGADILNAYIDADGTISYSNPRLIQSISSSRSEYNYPSEKAVYDFVNTQMGGLTFKVATSAPTVDDRSVITFVV